MSLKDDYRYQAEGYVKRCNEKELLELIQIYREAESKWNALKPGQLFLESGGYGDLFKMEIMKVLPEERKVVYKDHSLPEKPISTSTILPDPVFDSEEELQEYVNNQPPSFF